MAQWGIIWGFPTKTVKYFFLYERVDASNIILHFVVGRQRPEYGLLVAVYMKLKCPSSLSRAPPPMGNRNRPIVPSTVPAGPIARRGGGRHNAIFNIRCVH